MGSPNVGQILAQAIRAKQLELYPILPNILSARRQSDPKPAALQIAVPDEVVKNVRGDAERRDLIFMVRIPAAFVKALQSPIIQPIKPLPPPAPSAGPLIIPGR